MILYLKKININILIGVIFLLFTLILNIYTLNFLFFIQLQLSEKFFLLIFDIFLLFSSIIFFLKHNNKKFLKNYFKLLFFNFILICFFFLILEFFFGNWFGKKNINKLNIIKDRIIYYKLDDLYNFDNQTIFYSRDKFGFRGIYPNTNSIDILTIGGSTTDQRYISDGYTFQDVIHKEFKKIGKDVYTVNAGVDGQSTYGHLKNFDFWFPLIPNLQVKYFLFYIGINDFFIDAISFYDDLDNSKQKNITKKIKNQINLNSAIYNMISKFEGNIMALYFGLSNKHGHSSKDFDLTQWTDKPTLKNYENVMSKSLISYEKRLNRLVDKVNDYGSKTIFVTQSSKRAYEFRDDKLFGVNKKLKYQDIYINGVDYYHMMKLLNDITISVANKRNVMIIDLNNEIEFDIKEDFYDLSHHTASGAKKIGIYLFNKLKYLY